MISYDENVIPSDVFKGHFGLTFQRNTFQRAQSLFIQILTKILKVKVVRPVGLFIVRNLELFCYKAFIIDFEKVLSVRAIFETTGIFSVGHCD